MQEAELVKPEESEKPIKINLPEPLEDVIRLTTIAVLPTGEVGFCHTAWSIDQFKKKSDELDMRLMELTAKTLGKMIRNKFETH